MCSELISILLKCMNSQVFIEYFEPLSLSLVQSFLTSILFSIDCKLWWFIKEICKELKTVLEKKCLNNVIGELNGNEVKLCMNICKCYDKD